jgi:hypothetical protein
VAQGVGPEFKPQYCEKKKKKEKRNSAPDAGRRIKESDGEGEFNYDIL